ncbi:hypothetical protein [Bradyrhizobium sp. LMTR 3]|uniref:DUF7282 domain-containing protein n=1 Tax=Bradyrhizobium sp. LMTR 3 TaxID=189873 RepID=UPI000810E881|nr:hypothetical protein [Bradyrhizobium sp. LMTR 3]OCK55015.1 hypothetical protein LMTR3_09580 [Bradyrhizobium sp. LMTR 3]
MKNWLRENWAIYLPVGGVLLFAAGIVIMIVLQSRYPDIEVADQELVGGKVTIDMAFLKSDGFVAIHPSSPDGQLVGSSSIGHVSLKSGQSFLVEIRLKQRVKSGTKLFAVVHHDTGADQRYDFRQGEIEKDPIVFLGGEPVAVAFLVNSEERGIEARGAFRVSDERPEK